MQAIEVAALARLMSGDPDTAVPPGLTHLGDLAVVPSYARKPPFRLDMTDIDPGPRRMAEEYFRHGMTHYDGVRHFRIADALVVGQGTVIAGGNCLIRDSAAEFLAHGGAPDGLTSLGDGRFALKAAPTAVIDRPSLLLKRPWWPNYGHWLVDSAALLALADRFDLPAGWQIVTGRHHGFMQAIVRETLDLLASGVDVVEHPDDEVWRFAELHYFSPVHIPPLFKLPAAIAALREQVLRGRPSKRWPYRTIYVARGSVVPRRLVNEAEVIRLCGTLGIEVVSPEGMSLRDQAALFRDAALVVGVKGAALTNALFCAPGTHVVALSPGDFPDPFFWDLVGQSGGNYSEIFGPVASSDLPPAENPFTVDVGRLRAILTACFEHIASAWAGVP